jgi:ricin-type beta-trefoil lectin protein
VTQRDWAGGTNQQWRLAWVSPGVFEIVARHSGKLLEVSGQSTADGAVVTQWADLNGANQRWRIIPG